MNNYLARYRISGYSEEELEPYNSVEERKFSFDDDEGAFRKAEDYRKEIIRQLRLIKGRSSVRVSVFRMEEIGSRGD